MYQCKDCREYFENYVKFSDNWYCPYCQSDAIKEIEDSEIKEEN